jgi:N-glycosylase/DNA lyase
MGTYDQIKRLYTSKKGEIVRRLKEFEKLWLDGCDEDVFAELAFCILTPQSRAKVCWGAIVGLVEKDLLLKGNAEQIRRGLSGVRFKNKKARYVTEAREFFTKNGKIRIKSALERFDDVYERREWLVENIKGIGYKEASHFLRNISFGEKIAILDRHILKNLKQLGVIKQIPESISRASYMQIEKDMKEFAKQIGIPVSHLDLLLWCRETGEIFK